MRKPYSLFLKLANRISRHKWELKYPDRTVGLSVEQGDKRIEYIVSVNPAYKFSRLIAKEVFECHPDAIKQFDEFCRKAQSDELERVAYSG